VRRLAALAITMGLAWLLVVRLGTEPAGSAALALGVALVAGSIVGWLFEFLRLPRVIGYLGFGLICGPYIANIITEPMARDLRAASGIAIALIAFIAGLHVQLRRAVPPLSRVAVLAAVTLAIAWFGLAAVLYLAWPWLPIGPELVGAQRLAAVFLTAVALAGVSPTVTVAVIAESRASGPLARLATASVVLVELAVIVLFAIGIEGARLAFGTSARDGWTIAVSTAWTLAGSMSFGALLGAIFALYLRFIGREVTIVLLSLVALVAGLGAQLQFEPLLVGLAAGLVVRNVLGEAGEVLRETIQRGALPVLVLFFAAIGASLHVEALATIGLVALAVSAVRLVLMRASARVGARVARIDEDSPSGRLVWRALVATSGITLGLTVIVAADHPQWGGALQTLLVAVVAVNQLVAPILLRAALTEAGETGGSSGGLVVVSNREPWIHDYAPDGSIVARHSPGGVSVALDALMRERGGVWVAHGAGGADRAVVDERSSIDVPPDAPAYRLRRLWLSDAEVEGYYAGFSNSALWPLCHQAHVRPQFRASDWETYQAVNLKFAEAVALEAPPDSSVFLNDYHLSLVAKDLRARRPQLRTALFWHIPWPDVDRLRICPWRKELLEGLLNNDLLAFQLVRDQKSFLAAAAAELGVSVSGELVFYGDRAVRVVAIPIGADFDRITEILGGSDLPDRMRQLEAQFALAGSIVGIGVDRLDYTKGIPERLSALDRVLERRPGLAERFRFVQIGVPSRGEVPAYAEIAEEIDRQVARINVRHGRGPNDGPILFLKQSFPLTDLVALYRLARFCIVSSLHDGMNLVAKEFVAARDDLDGVLILSELAGAAQELDEALIINPYDEQGFVGAIERAIDMPVWERRRRVQALRRRVAGRDVLAWASDILNRLERKKAQGFLSG